MVPLVRRCRSNSYCRGVRRGRLGRRYRVQAIGASVLTSAGLLSIVAGLAAQSTLANVFAGVQLAFSDAIRLEDVVVADGERGQIEEITLTYVVVRIWDVREHLVEWVRSHNPDALPLRRVELSSVAAGRTEHQKNGK